MNNPVRQQTLVASSPFFKIWKEDATHVEILILSDDYRIKSRDYFRVGEIDLVGNEVIGKGLYNKVIRLNGEAHWSIKTFNTHDENIIPRSVLCFGIGADDLDIRPDHQNHRWSSCPEDKSFQKHVDRLNKTKRKSHPQFRCPCVSGDAI